MSFDDINEEKDFDLEDIITKVVNMREEDGTLIITKYNVKWLI